MQYWENDKNTYFFGGAPVLDQSGRIVTIDIQDLWLKYSRMNIYMINWLKQLGRIVFIKKDLGKTTSVNQEGWNLATKTQDPCIWDESLCFALFLPANDVMLS